MCRCGEIDGDGVCGNDEEECVGSGPGSGRDLLGEMEIVELGREDGEGKSCCGGSRGKEMNERGESGEKLEVKEKTSCCGGKGKDEKVLGGGGCCSGSGSASGTRIQPVDGPIKLRTGGLGIVVCGPKGMIVSFLSLSSLSASKYFH